MCLFKNYSVLAESGLELYQGAFGPAKLYCGKCTLNPDEKYDHEKSRWHYTRKGWDPFRDLGRGEAIDYGEWENKIRDDFDALIEHVKAHIASGQYVHPSILTILENEKHMEIMRVEIQYYSRKLQGQKKEIIKQIQDS